MSIARQMMMAAAGGAGESVSISLVDERILADSTVSSFTFSSVNFGSGGQKRLLVFCAVADYSSGGDGGAATMEIDGQSAQSLATVNATSREASLSAFTVLTSATSGQIVVTPAASLNACIISVYEIAGLDDTISAVAATDTGGTPHTASLQRPAGESAVAYFTEVADSSDTVSFTTTSTTASEDGVENSSVLQASYGSGVSIAEGTENLSVSFTGGSTLTPATILLCLQ